MARIGVVIHTQLRDQLFTLAGCGHKKVGDQAVDDIAAFLGEGRPLRAVRADMLARIA